MKYGPIICDPTSKEAEALIGKRVVASSNFSVIQCRPNEMHTCTLEDIDYRDSKPFKVRYIDWDVSWNTFIREVIEEETKYRSYKDCDEMVEDFCERFGVPKADCSMPMIWLKAKWSSYTGFVQCFFGEGARLDMEFFKLSELFKRYTYLDGSPVGKLEDSE